MGQTIINLQGYKYSCLANIDPVEKIRYITRVFGNNKGIFGKRRECKSKCFGLPPGSDA